MDVFHGKSQKVKTERLEKSRLGFALERGEIHRFLEDLRSLLNGLLVGGNVRCLLEISDRFVDQIDGWIGISLEDCHPVVGQHWDRLLFRHVCLILVFEPFSDGCVELLSL